MLKCPRCGSDHVVKNGRIHNGKQNHRCRGCGRQFVEHPEQKRISEETKVLIDKLLLERIPLAGIARVCEVSEPWLQKYVNHLYESVDRHVEVEGEKGGPSGAAVRRAVELRRKQAPGAVGLDRARR
jgi:transposase-like protein